jgi:hypothetical protein
MKTKMYAKLCLNRFDLESDDDNDRSFSRSDARDLCDHLKHRRLPGLSSQDQMQLMAMIDTFVEVSSMTIEYTDDLILATRFLAKAKRWMKTVLDLLLFWKITFI